MFDLIDLFLRVIRVYSFRLIVKRRKKEITARYVSVRKDIFAISDEILRCDITYVVVSRGGKKTESKRVYFRKKNVRNSHLFEKTKSHALQESPWVFLCCFSMWIFKGISEISFSIDALFHIYRCKSSFLRNTARTTRRRNV